MRTEVERHRNYNKRTPAAIKKEENPLDETDMQQYSTNKQARQVSMTDHELSQIVSTLKETDPAPRIKHGIEESGGESYTKTDERAVGARHFSYNHNQFNKMGSLFDSEGSSSVDLFKNKTNQKPQNHQNTRNYVTGTSSLR